jgi:hypothetical protein
MEELILDVFNYYNDRYHRDNIGSEADFRLNAYQPLIARVANCTCFKSKIAL